MNNLSLDLKTLLLSFLTVIGFFVIVVPWTYFLEEIIAGIFIIWFSNAYVYDFRFTKKWKAITTMILLNFLLVIVSIYSLDNYYILDRGIREGNFYILVELPHFYEETEVELKRVNWLFNLETVDSEFHQEGIGDMRIEDMQRY
ncbi:MAG: hypothetical protein U5L96_12025 [Owenweeksia sp.]|nr:hypothetical protein [Owenweeksia sp.]